MKSQMSVKRRYETVIAAVFIAACAMLTGALAIISIEIIPTRQSAGGAPGVHLLLHAITIGGLATNAGILIGWACLQAQCS